MDKDLKELIDRKNREKMKAITNGELIKKDAKTRDTKVSK